MSGKKLWKTPELIVLAKGKPEESVLDFCKAMQWAVECEGYEHTPDDPRCLVKVDGNFFGCKTRSNT